MTIDFLLLIITFYLILVSIIGYGYQLAVIGNINCRLISNFFLSMTSAGLIPTSIELTVLTK